MNRDEILKEAAVIIGHDTCAATDPAGIARFYKDGMSANDVREAWWKDYGNYMRGQEVDIDPLRKALDIVKRGAEDGNYFFYKGFFYSCEDEEQHAKEEFLVLLESTNFELSTVGYCIDIPKCKLMLASEITYFIWDTMDGDHIPCIIGRMCCHLTGVISTLRRQEVSHENT